MIQNWQWEWDHKLPYSGLFWQGKILPKAGTVVWDINFTRFNFAKHAEFVPQRSGWSMYAYIQLLCACMHLDSYFLVSSSTCWSWYSNLWMQKWTLALIPSSSFKYGPILTSDIAADGSPDDSSLGGLVAESWSMTVEPSVVVRTKLSDKQLENLVNYNPCKKYPLYSNIIKSHYWYIVYLWLLHTLTTD